MPTIFAFVSVFPLSFGIHFGHVINLGLLGKVDLFYAVTFTFIFDARDEVKQDLQEMNHYLNIILALFHGD